MTNLRNQKLKVRRVGASEREEFRDGWASGRWGAQKPP